MKKRLALALAALLLIIGGGALAQSYSLPYAGLTLALEGAEVTLQGLPQGALLSAQWPDGARAMLYADLLAEGEGMPEGAQPLAEAPGFAALEGAPEVAGIPTPCLWLYAAREGLIYRIELTGAPLPRLHEAGIALAQGLTFTDLPDFWPQAGAGFDPVADDGQLTPLALLDFTPETWLDETTLTLQTLPGAQVTLRTAADSLRATADANGLCRFTVSTRREQVYAYVLTAAAEGRTPTERGMSITRRLDEKALEAFYRQYAFPISRYGYETVLRNPGRVAGEAVTFRGRVEAVGASDGFPCLLLATNNPSAGVWQNPVWVLLAAPLQAEVGDIYTVYGNFRGDLIEEAPAVIGRLFYD
ncbi:MAG: hypothetical protein LBN04_04610 [Oscillospiraceae bacterium]|jgi:hypothetical protein|nr:hypothetical protein [Oscillospiraceae bacterium]